MSNFEESLESQGGRKKAGRQGVDLRSWTAEQGAILIEEDGWVSAKD